MIPVLNEERHIDECLDSVLAQDYPGVVEILVADGGSCDATRALVARRAASDPRIRLMQNTGRNQAAGLNVAIRASHGEVVARLDGHAAWRPWHLRRCIELLGEWDADNVGGTMENLGETLVGRAAGRAARSPFGVGGARYRYGTRTFETDTVFLGCFRRSALDRVGGFDDTATPHEDYELNARIRKGGGRIVFSPDIPVTYYTRPGWRSLAVQYFLYGRAKARVARRQPTVLRPYHLVPPSAVAVLLLGATTVVLERGRGTAVAALVAYGMADLVASWRASIGEDADVRRLLPAVFPVLHGAWGVGFWVGLLDRRRHGGL